ncbi:MAG: hypothetical protein IPF99_29195 [Deltaproteobacteria bacterium]|nr:hypothetical protein [Deltaproteobacteria bacterium]MBP6833986.1 hypothetical protein [Deltaproteobacteria bacterium]
MTSREFDPSWCSFAPRLSPATCEAHSDPTEDYNCLAFAANDQGRWWEPYVVPPTIPGVYWPTAVEPDNTVSAWSAALATVGFAPCADDSCDPALVKVALFAIGETATHAARQLLDGRWVSKLGDEADVIHTRASDVGGGGYGEPVCLLARPRLPVDP